MFQNMSRFSVYGSAAERYAAENNMKNIINRYIEKTATPGVISAQGNMCGIFAPQGEDENGSVIVCGTDGVGSKLKLANLMNRHDTVGIDCVALCANDVISSGARPLFFTTYLSMGKRKSELIDEIFRGVAEGCIQAGCSLIGGEVSESPGTYSSDEYDLAGFCVGSAERSNIIDSVGIQAGNALIALRSSGLHSDGYAAVMRILRVTDKNIRIYLDDLGKTLGEELITPSRIYVKSILKLLEVCKPTGITNITGGGIYRGIPNLIPQGLCAQISRAKMKIHPIFSVIKSMNSVDDNEMFATFNMGIGMMLAVPSDKADEAVALLNSCGEEAYIVGEVTEGEIPLIID